MDSEYFLFYMRSQRSCKWSYLRTAFRKDFRFFIITSTSIVTDLLALIWSNSFLVLPTQPQNKKQKGRIIMVCKIYVTVGWILYRSGYIMLCNPFVNYLSLKIWVLFHEKNKKLDELRKSWLTFTIKKRRRCVPSFDNNRSCCSQRHCWLHQAQQQDPRVRAYLLQNSHLYIWLDISILSLIVFCYIKIHVKF